MTVLTDVYIQEQGTAGNYIQFNITASPTITAGQKVSIPVLFSASSVSGFAEGTQIMISFFTNSLEVDQRLGIVEGRTQNQSAVSGTTTFTGGINIGNNYITTTQPVFNASGQLVSKNYVDTAIGIGTNNTTERWVNSYIGSDTNSGSV